MWYALACADEAKQPQIYDNLLKAERVPIYDAIDRDIARCYPDHELFKDADSEGQIGLSNILRAYAQYNPAVGYCQGMGRVVGLFLMYMKEEVTLHIVLLGVVARIVPICFS